MKCYLTIFLWLSGLGAMAQHNLYNWQLKGYTGTAHYYNPDKRTSDYLKLDHHLWYRLEMSRSLGNSFGLALSGSFGNIKGVRPQGSTFITEARMTSARLYFYTDNGWLLKSKAFVSPYFFGGYGLGTFTISDTGASNEREYLPVLPFGMGLKFRLTERWQLDLQTEAVYNTKSHLNATEGEQNKYNNSFLHTGLALGYSFGFKSSSFKASRFYTSFQDTHNHSSARLTPMVSPADSLLNKGIVSKQNPVLVTDQNKGESTDKLRSQRVAIQPSDSTYNAYRSRTIEKEFNPGNRPVAPAARKTEQLRTSKNANAIPDSTTGTSVPASNVYENDRFSQNTGGLLENDRSELARANKENAKLRHTRDSLSTLLVKDSLQVKKLNPQDSIFKTLDNKTLRYMEQQAALNDSIRQRLAFYQNELMRLEASKSITPATKMDVKSSFDTKVFFKVNSFEVPSQSFNELLSLAAQLKANPSRKLQLTGYADQTGNLQDNLVLSRKRVEEVGAFFQAQGIEKERLLLQYFGEANSKEALNSLNRKVILKTID